MEGEGLIGAATLHASFLSIGAIQVRLDRAAHSLENGRYGGIAKW
jgi:hypothetical protein